MANNSNSSEPSYVKDGEQVKSTVKRSNIFNEFFWICSGANRYILRQCPTEYSKYFGIGGTIFFTAAMATLSRGYAFYTIFQNTWIAIAFGIFWVLLIFNLDRFIVNTMYSDGKYTISWGELAAGTPRLIIAIFLGIVISTPLEMKIFEDRINSQLVQDNIERTNIARAAVTDGNKPLIIRRDQLEAERKEIQKRLSEANDELKKEGEASALSGISGHGPIYKEKETNRDSIQKEFDDWEDLHKTELNDLISQIKTNTVNIGDDIEKGNKENGFCVRYEAFANVKKESHAARIVSIFIMLMFIIIEIAPTFFKMMLASGPYDELLNEEMHRKKVRAIQNVSNLNDEVNTQIQITTEKNKNKLEAEVAANKQLLEKIASVQAELLETAIEEWRKAELEKIHADPSKYIQSNTTKG